MNSREFPTNLPEDREQGPSIEREIRARYAERLVFVLTGKSRPSNSDEASTDPKAKKLRGDYERAISRAEQILRDFTQETMVGVSPASMDKFNKFLDDAAREGITADIKLARIIAERAGENTEWQDTQTLGGNEFFASPKEGHEEFIIELNRLGYEIKGSEVRKRKE